MENLSTQDSIGNIAVIGMSCRFPGAGNLADFWKNLREGKESIVTLSDQELLSAGVHPSLLRDPKYVRAASALEDVDKFDARFFGFSPREALAMDPQHRLFMECAWEALENAGCTPETFDGQIGVYAGVSLSHYLLFNLYHRLGLDGFVGDLQTLIGNDKDYLATHVSYKLNLKGPSISVQTACSSSLVAVCLASQSLLNYECDAVLAGGVTVRVPNKVGYLYEQGGLMSPDGHCRTFDSRAQGTVFGSGVGIVVLKRLEDALQAGDPIRAVIKGFATNNDGSAKIGYTAPSIEGQSRVIAAAQALAGVEPESLSYIEAHGTGTALGDPIEITALSQVFQSSTSRKGFCALGSAKTNFGHLESAAGIAGFIKTVLSLENRLLPPSLHFEKPNPEIDLAGSPFYVNTSLSDWVSPRGPRRAGVSSFGIGGTNAHVVLEEAPAREKLGEALGKQVLTLTAKSGEALKQLAGRYAEYLEGEQRERFADVCFTANTGRGRFNHRLAVMAETAAEAREKLTAYGKGEPRAGCYSGQAEAATPKVAFLFTGQGSQYVGMGRGLYETQPVFRKAVDKCEQILEGRLSRPLKSVLFEEATSEHQGLDQTANTQPALFAIEYGLGELWRSWGVEPRLVLGHSIGEYVAACMAGIFSVEEGLRLVAERGRLMQELKRRGTMAAVYAPEEEVRRRLERYGGEVSIAAVNGPGNVVISGDEPKVGELIEELKGAGIRTQELKVSHGFHSVRMEPMLEAFEKEAEKVKYGRARIGIVTNRTGRLAEDGEMEKASYWVRQLRETVQFARGVETLSQQGSNVYLEIGPRPTLTALGQQQSGGEGSLWLGSLREGRDDREEMLTTAARLQVRGLDLRWEAIDRDTPRRRVALPTYPFQRERFWFDRPEATSRPAVLAEGSATGHPLLERRLNSPLREIQFESVVRATSPLLKDHAINGTAVFPGAGYIEMAHAAAGMSFGEGRYTLEQVMIAEPLVIAGEEARTLQLIVTPEGDKGGSFRIVSSGEQNGNVSWKVHATGTIRAQNAEPRAVRVAEIRAACADAEMAPEALYRELETRGLQLGAGFQWIEKIWRGDGEALGRTRKAREEDGAENYGLHPGLVDSCFQLLAMAMPRQTMDGAIFVPVAFETIRWYSGVAKVAWCHAKVVPGENRDTLKADVSLLEEDGRVILEISGLQARRVRAEMFGSLPSDSWTNWLYEIRWQPMARPKDTRPLDFLRSPHELEAVLEPQRIALNVEHHLDSYSDLVSQLDRLTASYIAEAMTQLGWQWVPGKRISIEGIADSLSVTKTHSRFFSHLLGILLQEGFLKIAGSDYEVLSVPDIHSMRGSVPDLIAQYPGMSAELTLLNRCGQQLAGVLRGTSNPLEVLFPGGSLETLERLYRDSPIGRACNTLVQRAVSAALERLPKGRVARILEIGAGTGGTTTFVLPALPAAATEYVFTDVSPQFTSRAQMKFAAYPFVRYDLLDIERDPEAQGFQAHRFDLVIAANVLHATGDLRQMLRNVQKVLAPGGLLLMLEGTGPQRWLDLIFGMTEGWWKFADRDLRPNHPLLSQDRWITLLESAGFSTPVSLPRAGEKRTGLPEPALILAQAPVSAEKPSSPWLIYADRHGVAANLAGALEKRGEKTVLVFAGDEAKRSRIGSEPWRGVVHLWSLDSPAASELTTKSLQEAEERSCGSVLQLVQSLVGSEAATLPRLWLVTRGAQAAGEDSATPAIAQAPVWGLGRVVALEHPGLRCTCVDLDPAADGIDALVEELLAPDAEGGEEDQIAFRAGNRHVARLTRHTLREIPSPHYQLEISSRGLLENLSLCAASPRSPGSGELQIEVVASGLNFKDVLNALGTYPGDAGALGLECAGKVVAVGANVEGIKVGDDVVAFAPGSFSNVVTTRADLVARKPAQLTFEEAAAVPVAFITAHYGLRELGRMQSGQSVLIHAAAGGVGMAAVRLAQQAGARIFATAGSEEKRNYLRGLGIFCVMNSRSTEFAAEVMEKTGGRGVDIVLNSLAGEFIERSLSVMVPGGRFIEIGKTGIWSAEEVAGYRKDIEYFTIAFDEMMAQKPAWVGAMFQGVMKEFDAGTLKALPVRAFGIREASTAFRFMAQARHTGKIVLTHRDNGGAFDLSSGLRPDATYLIAGGLGGLGLLVAGRLAEHGARHLVLVGRSAPSEEAREAVERLRSSGLDVQVMRGDISKEEDVAAVIRQISESMPPLRGILHAAGVLDDGVVVHQNWERFDRVMAPKVSGAWNLHTATRSLPLDFFVLFSSLASVLGPPGQSNHAAANAFLDALAHYRRQDGLAGASINWGGWSETGAAARLGERVASVGVGTIAPQQGLDALEAVLRAGATQIGVFRIDWPEFLRRSPSRRIPPLLSEVARREHSGAQAAAGKSAFRERLRQTTVGERHNLILEQVRDHAARVLGLEGSVHIDPARPLNELGLDSLMAIELRNALGVTAGQTLPATLLFDYPTVQALSDYLAREVLSSDMTQAEEPRVLEQERETPRPAVVAPIRSQMEPVAIVGLGCRFPGAGGPNGFWDLLVNGVDAIAEVPSARWDIDSYYDPTPGARGKMYTRRGGFLGNVDEFDAAFFGISPREAVCMDPQQRIVLETAWEALEHAGQAPDRLTGSNTGVFLGISQNEYTRLLSGPAQIDLYIPTGNALSVAAGRVSYLLGLNGPSIAVDTACSSSLVAVHLAAQSLRTGECEMALAGGVNLMLTPMATIGMSEMRMMAPDGRCKTFDAAADGFVRGEGCGLVVLKRLSDALENGDRILAVIRGSAVNQDGRSGGLTAPNGPAQEKVIRRALAAGGVSPSEVSYVEAHGTGTALGDPIEVRALAAVLGEGREADRPLAIGSVKTNFGHLESAAGVAGLIKTVLSLQHQQIPPHLHFKTPSPHIAWDRIPVVIPTEPTAWASNGGRRIAGVSSFGFSGTNAHVVLEEAPEQRVIEEREDRPAHVLTLSAKSGEALRELASRYADRLDGEQSERFADICFTANTGRAGLNHRLALVAQTGSQARQKLIGFLEGTDRAGCYRGQVDGATPKLAFLFTGQGSQYDGMGRLLYETEPTFRNTLMRCEKALSGRLERTLLSVLYEGDRGNEASALDQTQYTQPALFALEFGLAELWRSWGVTPRIVAGHSIGEYVAACVAGIFSLEDGIRLVAERGRLMQQLKRRGAMAAVYASEVEVSKRLEGTGGEVSLAAVNGPQNVVISGDEGKLAVVVEELKASGIRTQPLKVSHAFHSHLMEPMLDAFEKEARKVRFGEARIPIVANRSGKLAAPGEMECAEYWVRQLRETVQFFRTIETLREQGCGAFLEIGPKPTLTMLGQQSAGDVAGLWVGSLRQGRNDWDEMLSSAARLNVSGIDLNWAGVDRNYSRRRVDLPTYPFQRKRYWFGQSAVETETTVPTEPVPAGQSDPWSEWLYEVQWESQTNHVLSADFLPSPPDIASVLEPQRIALNAEHHVEIYADVIPELDRLTVSYITEALAKLGWDWTPQRRVAADSVAEFLGVGKAQRPLLFRLLGILQEEGLLRKVGDDYEVLRSPAARDVDETLAVLNKRYPGASAEATLLDRCGRNLAGVLNGSSNPLEVLFPGGSLDTLEKLYQESPASRASNGLVQRAVTSALGKLPKGRTAHILELGAGTGGTTSSLLPALPPDSTEYVFTDVSPQFTARARMKFKPYPFLRYEILDIEKDPILQGFQPHRFDLIVAANVLHATADLRQVLGHVRQLLAPNGLLLLVEGTGPQRWLDLIFGMTEGWWKFTADEVRPNHPLLSQDKWLAVLERTGFLQPVALPASQENAGLPEPALIMARAPGLEAPQQRSEKESDQWLVLADRQGVAEKLAAALEKRGDKAVLVFADGGIDPANPDDFLRLVQNLTGEDWPRWRGIVHLWSLDSPDAAGLTPAALEEAQVRSCGSVLHLVQALAQVHSPTPPRLWLVTRGAQPAGAQSTPLAVAQAPLWGLGRVVALEHPDVWGGLIDLEPGTSSENEASQLLDQVSRPDGEDQVALRGEQRYVSRLVRAENFLSSRETPQLSSNGTYLVTGGLGVVGLKVADWLVQCGAKHVVLTGRKADEALSRKTEAIQAMEHGGAKIRVIPADISDPVQMGAVFEQLRNDGPPLRGIIHAAAEITARTLQEMTLDDLLGGLRAKVAGTWVLHELTREMDLDFFVLFSSTTSLLGSGQLAHYAAANQFLDAFAHFRKAHGKPALTINWGIWDQFRGGAAMPGQPSLQQFGLRAMPAADALDVLGRLLTADSVQLAVSAMDWSALKPVYEARRRRPFLEHIKVSARTMQASAQGTDLLRRLEHASAAGRRELLVDFIGREVARILGFEADFKPNPQQGFFEMGMDSLTSVELKSRLESGLGRTLPTTMALEYPTMESLAAFIDREILEAPVSASSPDAEKESVEAAGEEKELENLSREKLLSLLAQELESLGEEQPS